jgi:hypothetical protein
VSSADERLEARTALERSPEFDLECLFDDAENPSELTIFSPERGRAATEWLTVERSAAIPVDEIR